MLTPFVIIVMDTWKTVKNSTEWHTTRLSLEEPWTSCLRLQSF